MYIKSCFHWLVCCLLVANLYAVHYPYKLPPLPYGFADLRPYIDRETMCIHYTKHHQAYVNKLNDTLKPYPKLHKTSLSDLLKNPTQIPTDIRQAVIDFGGGNLNHSFFWTIMAPPCGSQMPVPAGKLAQAITKQFGSFTNFKKEFSAVAKKLFGSGWAWLVVTPEKQLKIMGTADQNTPLTDGYLPILTLDVWEHAYYLKYQNRRGDFIGAWWHVVNWPQVEKNYHNALKGIFSID